MLQVGLFDGCFSSQRSMGVDNPLSQNGDDYLPTNFEWFREMHCDINFYTDLRLDEVKIDWMHRRTNVALLIEPEYISKTHYEKTLELCGLGKFDYVLSYNRKFIDYGNSLGIGGTRFLFYPFGTTYIAKKDWKKYDKTKLVSMTYSEKTKTDGHKLRHEIAQSHVGHRIDLTGKGAGNYIQNKVDALSPYMYSVVVENCAQKSWFTEKLIDCFATYTVPLYWGTPDIGSFFNKDGIIPFSNIDELEFILDNIGEKDYADFFYASEDNFNRAKHYCIPEDWIYNNCRFIFER